MSNIELTVTNEEIAPALQKARDLPSVEDVEAGLTLASLAINNKMIVVGSDLTESAEKREYNTVQAAIESSVAGDVIQVLAGAYTGTITLKQGVTINCMSNAYFYNANVVGSGIVSLQWLGDAVFVITDNTGQAVYLNACVDYRFEVGRIENWGISTNADRPGFYALSSNGEFIAKTESITYNNEIISINNNWDSTPRKTTVTTKQLSSKRVAANVGSLKVSPIGAGNGADVDWYANGLQQSDNNNCAFVGAATTPPSGALPTKLNVLTAGAVFDGDNASFIAVGHANSETILEMSGLSRHKSPKFAHSTGSGKVNTTLKIFAPCVAVAGDTDSVFVNTGYGSITETSEAS